MRSSHILRILIIGALSALVMAPGSGAPSLHQGSAHLRLKAGQPVLEPADQGRRVVPRLPGFGTASLPGQPMLPIKVLMVAIPEGSVPELRVLSAPSELLGALDVAPAPRVRVPERLERPRGVGRKDRGQGHDRNDAALQDYEDDFTADAEVDGRDEDFPAAVVRLGSIGYLREQRYVEVLFSPVLYNPVRGQARLVRELEADVVFDLPDGSVPSGGGPFEPDPLFENTYRDSLVNYEQGKLYRVRRGEAAPDATAAPDTTAASTAGTIESAPAAATGAVRYKLSVSRPGIYRLSQSYLMLHAPEMVTANPKGLMLSAEGVEVPILIRDAFGNPGEADNSFDAGDVLEFYGQPKRELAALPNLPTIFQANDFTDTQVYWLEAKDPAEPRRRIPSVSGAPTTQSPPIAPHFEDQAVWDENNLYLPLEDNDPFFSVPSLLAGSTQATRDISIPLPGMAAVPATATLTFRVRGGSDVSTVSLDHRTRVWVNNDTGGGKDDIWGDGETILSDRLDEAQSVLTNPTTVHFSAPGQAGVTLDKQYLDSVTIRYRRTFASTGDVLPFSYPNQATRFQVSGFSGSTATIFEVSRTLTGSLEADPSRITEAQAGGAPTTLTFDVPLDTSSGAPATRSFIVAGPAGGRLPDGIARAADPVLTNPANAADIVVIAARSTIDDAQGGALDNLLAYRFQSQGLTSKIVYVDQIYDEFAFGLRSVTSIRAFLSYAFDNWRGPGGTARPPSFVLIVGDATPDYKDTLQDADWVDQVPTMMLFQKNSILGYYSSDNWLASFRGADQIADIYLGRISTRTPQAAAEVFDKIRTYEQSPPAGTWKGRAVLLAGDGKDSLETADFEAVQDNLTSADFSTAPYSVPSPPLYLARSPWNLNAAAFKNALVNELQSGAAVLSYVGHGSFETWGGKPQTTFFTTQDAHDLTNGAPIPFMLNINCLAGGFHYLSAVGAIGEAMTNNANGGAIATLAPSGLSNTFVGDVATPTLFRSLLGIGRDRLLSAGAMALRTSLWSQNLIVDSQSYTFLGDPATLIATPAPTAPSGLSASAGNGEVALDWTAAPGPVAGYRILRATAAGGPYSTVACDPVTTTSCVDRTVINATTYYYYAVSLDSEGFWGGASNDNSDCDAGPECVLARPINPNPPAVPTGLAAVDAGTGGTLLLSWRANSESDLKSYRIFYGTTEGQYPTQLTFGPAVTSSLLVGLQDGIRYVFVISATNTSGQESTQSTPVFGVPHTIQGIAPPSSITDLKVTRSGQDLVLTWSQPTLDIYGRATTVARYDIYAAPTPNAVKSAINRIGTLMGATSTTFTHTGAAISPGNKFYVVTATDTNGFESGAGRELPNGINPLQISLVSASPLVVRLTWPAITTDLLGNPTLIHHYQIHRSATPAARASLNSSTIFRDNVQVLSVDLDLTGLSDPSYFSVIAVDNQGNLSPF
ncbi:MAG TPA: C25 family cysteine peptidase [Candidatus Polarisedimenticolia bacterium]|jgi:hypothetical protein|nr:C25 family cysteine peptidase [Candidatus Polarisedimenticolia bacterium]